MDIGFQRVTRRLALALSLLTVVGTGAAAWAQSSLGEGRRQATRSELEQAARATEQAAAVAPDQKSREKLLGDATALRQRLRNGDFLPGDRIYISVLGDSSLSDTFTVRGDRRLQMPNIPDISLSGVLDSEINEFLTKELARYLKNPTVSATGMVRLTLTGGVARNGFLTFPVDQSLTDVIMTAGGLGPNTQLDKATIKRSGKTIIDKKAFQDAIRLGRTVGDLSLRDGDEIEVPMITSVSQWQNWTRIMAVVAPLIFLIRIFTNGGGGGRGTRL